MSVPADCAPFSDGQLEVLARYVILVLLLLLLLVVVVVFILLIIVFLIESNTLSIIIHSSGTLSLFPWLLTLLKPQN